MRADQVAAAAGYAPQGVAGDQKLRYGLVGSFKSSSKTSTPTPIPQERTSTGNKAYDAVDLRKISLSGPSGQKSRSGSIANTPSRPVFSSAGARELRSNRSLNGSKEFHTSDASGRGQASAYAAATESRRDFFGASSMAKVGTRSKEETKMSDYKLSIGQHTSTAFNSRMKDTFLSYGGSALKQSRNDDTRASRENNSPTDSDARRKSITEKVRSPSVGRGEERKRSIRADMMSIIKPRARSPSEQTPTSPVRSSSAGNPEKTITDRFLFSPYLKSNSSSLPSVQQHPTTKFESPTKPSLPESVREKGSQESLARGKAERTGKTSTRESVHRNSCHPEIEMLLTMTLPKRTDALQYLFRKQPASPRGLVGLANLGNTCFMNSILQCIFSSELLTGYFLSGDHKADINSKSPLKGQLATAFGEAVREIMKYAGDSGKIYNPSNLKRYVEYWAPQFTGYNQQDAQEFLRFMLDGLHEDLNRILTRPKFSYKDDEVDSLNKAIMGSVSLYK
ncbi:ubiquitin carboxyl-terminal hydrolase [Dinochytrium kinnereticum]|nr:ubiquitin carboxyl-terminal hydrolase [Dinochytrium kinnereticum]